MKSDEFDYLELLNSVRFSYYNKKFPKEMIDDLCDSNKVFQKNDLMNQLNFFYGIKSLYQKDVLELKKKFL